jgi:hypothetical protein
MKISYYYKFINITIKRNSNGFNFSKYLYSLKVKHQDHIDQQDHRDLD